MFQVRDENERQNMMTTDMGVGKHKSSGLGGEGKGLGHTEPAQKRVALGTLTNIASRSTLQIKKQADKVSLAEMKDVVTDKENVLSQGYYISSDPLTDRSLLLHRPMQSDLHHMDCNISCDEDSVQLLSFENEGSVEEGRESRRVEAGSADTDAEFEERLDRLITLAEYRDEIYTYLREAEMRYRAKPNYMRKQPDITSHMRGIMVDWMVEVSEEYKLSRETLFLSVNYVDRFLSQMSVLRGKLQLVGTAAMFIASKYEEIYPPEVKEFAYITDDTYTLQQVIRMEYLMLRALCFDVAAPTASCFCERYLKECGIDERTSALAMYLIELTLLDDLYLEFIPSVIASSAICLANYTMSEEPWDECLRESTGYEVKDFESCLRMLHQTYCGAPSMKQQAITTKYSHSRFFEVSKMQAPSFLLL